MAKVIKFALLGGAIGAGVAYYRSSQAPEEGQDVASEAAKSAAGFAAAGAVVGLFAARRARRKDRKARAIEALKAGSIVEAARIARPAVEHALEVARER